MLSNYVEGRVLHSALRGRGIELLCFVLHISNFFLRNLLQAGGGINNDNS